jgi:hypothetical protein
MISSSAAYSKHDLIYVRIWPTADLQYLSSASLFTSSCSDVRVISRGGWFPMIGRTCLPKRYLRSSLGFFGPAPVFHCRGRCPEIRERYDRTALFCEAANAFLNVVGELLLYLMCFGIDAGPNVFSFFRRTRRPFASVVQRWKKPTQTLPSRWRSIFLIQPSALGCRASSARVV